MVDVAKDWVHTNAGRYPDATALENFETGETLSWTLLDERVGALAGHLRDHFRVGLGDRVMLLAEGDSRTFELQFACMRLGAILVPLNWRLAIPELVELALDAQPKVAAFDGVWQETALKVADATAITHRFGWRCNDDTADYDETLTGAQYVPPRTDLPIDLPSHILHTSGTTGKPKGAITTVKTLSWHLLNVISDWPVSGPGAKLLNPMPLFHAGGLTTVATAVLMTGGAVTTMRRFDAPVVFAALADPRRNITHFTAPPIMWAAIADSDGFNKARFPSLQFAQVAGGVPSIDLLDRWLGKGVELQQAYGGTELGPAVTSMPRGTSLSRPTSAGKAVPYTHIRLVTPDGVDAAIGDVGEVWINGPSVTPGYWRPNGTVTNARTDDGWFRTGDVARVDADGFYYLVDRVKDMYKSGGENVAPAEVERVIATHPAVAEVAIIGVSDPKWGEVGRAFVVTRPGRTITLEEIKEYCTDKVARFKTPHSLVLLDSLPRNTTGKVVKTELKKQYGV